jgi:hypothetical protein
MGLEFMIDDPENGVGLEILAVAIMIKMKHNLLCCSSYVT